jgi:two-component sensor histidine kinase
MPAVVILIYNEVTLRNNRTAEIHQTALRTGQLAALEMQRIFAGAESTLTAMARAPVLREFTGQCASYLADILEGSPQFTSISAIDATGVMRCSSTAVTTPVRVDDRPYFIEAMRTNAFVVGEYTRSRISGMPALPVAVPIRDEAGQAAGVLVAGIDLDWLEAVLQQRSFGKNDALTIADRNGVIIAREPFPERFVGTKIPDDFMHLVTGDAPGTMEVRSQDGTERIIGYFPASVTPAQVYVSAGISLTDAMQPVNQATQRNGVIVAAGSALAFLLAWLAARALLQRPVGRILATVNAWRQGDDTARTGMNAAAGELELIGGSFDAFMDELVAGRTARREAEENRDLLARELQHRTKNTLATVQAIAAQTFREGEPVADAQRSFGERLAAMGRAQDVLMEADWKSADLGNLVRQTVEPFEPGQFDIRGGPTEINNRAALALSMVVHELATNAAKYGALSEPDGRIVVDWRIGEDGGFEFHWIEQDGPPTETPLRSGFGTRMMQRVLAGEIDAQMHLEFPGTGLQCRIKAPASAVALVDEAEMAESVRS